MSKRPMVSVLIPTYNSEKTVCRALSSVFAQTLQPVEVIVVDDGSSDNTASIVENFPHPMKPGFLKTVRLDSNYGPSYTRNIGWEMASGEFLAFLDSDDSWHPRKLEIQLTYMLKHSELALTGHMCLRLSESAPLPVLPKNWNVNPAHGWQLLMFGRFFLTTSVVIIKREIPFRFDPQKRYSEDRLLWLQIVLHGYKIARLELPLTYLYKAPYGETGLSRHLWELEKGELDVFYQLRQIGFLSRGQEILLKSWSFLKYMRRLWICWRRKRVA